MIKRNWCCWGLILILIFAAGSAAAATRRALLVGLDRYSPAYGPGDLDTCINDASGIRQYLMLGDALGRWSSANLSLLTNSSATKANIRNTLSNLAAASTAGDLVVYFQSSHGGQNSGTSTYLCSYNDDYTDTELGSDLARFSSAVNVVVIVDACHSGGLFKSGDPWPFAERAMEAFREAKAEELRSQGISVPKTLGSNIAFMTACDYNQYSFCDSYYSFYAKHLIQGSLGEAADSNGNGDYDFYELHTHAKARASAEEPEQTAQHYNQALLSALAARSAPGAGPATVAPRLQLFAGDFSGNQRTDIAVFRASSGLWLVRGLTRAYYGRSGDIPVPADYNGDGRADIAVFRPSAGLWMVRGLTRFYYGQSGDTPIPMHYRAGYTTAGIFRPSSGLWSFRGGNKFYFGRSGDIPVPGPYVTRSENWGAPYLAIFRPTTGLWTIRGVTRFYFGRSGDTPVPGAYTGQSTDDPWRAAIFRSATGLWALRGIGNYYYGRSGDIPVPADYNTYWGDEMAIFRPATGLWSIRGVGNYYYGRSGDTPVSR